MVQDHVHMLIRIPPQYAVAEVMGYIKGKSAIAVARQFGGRQRNFHGERFWARGYAVSTVGFEEEQIRAYIKHQEQLDEIGRAIVCTQVTEYTRMLSLVITRK